MGTVKVVIIVLAVVALAAVAIGGPIAYRLWQADQKIPRVLIVEGSNVYHNPGCRLLSPSAALHKRPDVLALGYQPCPECTPEGIAKAKEKQQIEELRLAAEKAKAEAQRAQAESQRLAYAAQQQAAQQQAAQYQATQQAATEEPAAAPVPNGPTIDEIRQAKEAEKKQSLNNRRVLSSETLIEQEKEDKRIDKLLGSSRVIIMK